MDRSFLKGFWAAFTAFVIWGLFPLYWHQLRQVPAMQIVAHRVVWCTVSVVGYLLLRHGTGWLREALRRPRVPLMLGASSILISFNWGLYIWAVNNGHVVESSLGYFINPLVNVLLGVLLLHERLNTAQRVAVACAALGVAWLTWQLGAPPWIALGLALSFGSYGLIRKIAAVEAIPGLGIESVFLFLPALAWLLWNQHQGTGRVRPPAALYRPDAGRRRRHDSGAADPVCLWRAAYSLFAGRHHPVRRPDLAAAHRRIPVWRVVQPGAGSGLRPDLGGAGDLRR